MIYDPSHWYWTVAGDTSKVWSSSVAGFVDTTDDDYVVWRDAGNGPTPISSIEELAAIFAEQYPGGMLTTYAADRRWRKEVGGVEIDGIEYPTDRETQSKLTAAFLLASMDDPPEAFKWKLPNGSFTPPLNATTIQGIARAIGLFVNNCYLIEESVLSEIEAGTIATREQVDQAFA